jgi:molecular chaperone GrpE (heat shock protein)
MTEPFDSLALPIESPVANAPLPVLPRTDDLPVTPDQVSAGNGAPSTADPVVSGPAPNPLAELQAAVLRLVAESEKHNQRAAHRESVIDKLHAEVEKLRTGERRGTVRPLLVAVARLRDDLVKQGSGLPADFDAPRAKRLLHSFADSIEITLEDFGVATYTPKVGDDFDPRRHKAVASEPISDAQSVRTVAGVRKAGYEDIEAGVTLAQAEVTVYVDAPEQPAEGFATASEQLAPDIDEPSTAVPILDTADVPPVTSETATTPTVH